MLLVTLKVTEAWAVASVSVKLDVWLKSATDRFVVPVKLILPILEPEATVKVDQYHQRKGLIIYL